MLENLLFSLDCVAPYFLLIAAGLGLRKAELVPYSFFADANRFTFRVSLPLLLFCNIAEAERDDAAGFFLPYIFIVTVVSFAVIWLVTELLYKDKTLVGTLVQGAFRGNFVLLGTAIAGSVMGPPAVKIASLASIVVVPSYNVLSVIILMVRGKSGERKPLSGIVNGIVFNPLIIAMLVAVAFMLLGLRLPGAIWRTIQYIGSTSTPLGLLSVGGMIDIADAAARLKPAVYASAIKILVIPAIVMTASWLIGYRNEELLVLLVLSAAPAALSSYVMATEMGGDSSLASNILILTTFASAFVIAAGIYILRSCALI